MTIPKIIYQTWKTKNLHEKCVELQQQILKLNPGYQIILYDDNDIDYFIKSTFNEKIYNCYLKLNVGAAKADFWRYCILYKNGGIYLDMDSDILRPLDELIVGHEKCIITRENNPGIFNNWILMFEKEHPILFKTIINCCYNIENKTSNNVCYLTGPRGPFTQAVNQVMLPLYNKNINSLYFEKDEELNKKLNIEGIGCRFYGIDMGPFARWKNSCCNYLYDGHVHWEKETKIFND
jgi:mannosyltransferase OCH1-like enzyme